MICLLVAILARSRTVLDTAAIVAVRFELLDALRADGAVLFYGQNRFTSLADSSVRGAKTAVSKGGSAT